MSSNKVSLLEKWDKEIMNQRSASNYLVSVLDDLDQLYKEGRMDWRDYKLLYNLFRLYMIAYFTNNPVSGDILKIFAETLKEIYYRLA
jgi:hypothetical protein